MDSTKQKTTTGGVISNGENGESKTPNNPESKTSKDKAPPAPVSASSDGSSPAEQDAVSEQTSSTSSRIPGATSSKKPPPPPTGEGKKSTNNSSESSDQTSSTESDSSEAKKEEPETSKSESRLENNGGGSGAEESSADEGSSSKEGSNNKKDKSSLRKGKWTVEEEEYTSRIIQLFSSGLLTLPEGATLRSYLADKLNCDPMRITKKFTGACCLGRRVYHLRDRPQPSQAEIEMAKAELNHLEQRFRLRLEHEQSGIPLSRHQELLLAQPPSSFGNSYFAGRNVMGPTAPWLQSQQYPTNILPAPAPSNTASLPFAVASNPLLAQLATGLAGNGWPTSGTGFANESGQWPLRNEAPPQALGPAPAAPILQLQQQESTLQALNNLVNSLALGQVAANLSPALLAQLAASSNSNNLQQQQALREAFENQLKAQTSQASTQQAGNGNNGALAQNVNVSSAAAAAAAPAGLSPAEQLQRSYQAHLEALKNQGSSTAVTSESQANPSNGVSKSSSEKQPSDPQSQSKVTKDKKSKSKSKSTDTKSKTSDSSTKGKKTSKSKRGSKKKKKSGNDEEAGNILLLLRQSYEDARSGSNTSSSDDATIDKGDMTADDATVEKDETTGDEEVLDRSSSDSNGKKPKTSKKKSAVSVKVDSKPTTSQSTEKVVAQAPPETSRKRLQPNENGVTNGSQPSQPSLQAMSRGMFKTTTVVTDTSTLSRSESSSRTSSQPNESSSSMEDDSDSKSDKSDPTSSEESDKDQSEGSSRSKGPPRKRLKTSKPVQEFTTENVLEHSKRMDYELENPK